MPLLNRGDCGSWTIEFKDGKWTCPLCGWEARDGWEEDLKETVPSFYKELQERKNASRKGNREQGR